MQRLARSTLVLLIALVACSSLPPSLTDELDQRLVELTQPGNEVGYVLGSRIELEVVGTSDSAWIDLSRQDVVELDDLSSNRFRLTASGEGSVMLTVRVDGEVGAGLVTVAMPERVAWGERFALVDGGLGRAPLRFVGPDLDLQSRHAVASAEGAEVVTPARGQDELWLAAEGDSVSATVTIADRTYELDPVEVLTDPVIDRIRLEESLGTIEAQVIGEGERRLIGAPVVWSVDGEVLERPSDSPGDHFVRHEGDWDSARNVRARTVCANVGAVQRCDEFFLSDDRQLIVL